MLFYHFQKNVPVMEKITILILKNIQKYKVKNSRKYIIYLCINNIYKIHTSLSICNTNSLVGANTKMDGPFRSLRGVG